jgi:hypothetical protein
MPWPCVEVEEVAPPLPACSTVVGDYLVTISGRQTGSWTGLLPQFGAFTVLHLPTETSRAFSGLDAYHKNHSSVATMGGKAWVTGGTAGLVGSPPLTAIDPTSGAFTTSHGTGSGLFCLEAGGYLWYAGLNSGSSISRYNPATNSTDLAATASGARGMGSLAGRLFVASNSPARIAEIDVDTGAIVGVWSFANYTDGLAAVHAGSLYWGDGLTPGLVRFNPTDGPSSIPCTPPGVPSFYSERLVAHGGMLCAYVGSDRVVVIDPDTGNWDVDTLSPTRGRRYHAISAGGHLWVPSGEPTGETP